MRATLLYLIFLILTVPAISQDKLSSNASRQPYMLVDTFRVDSKFLVLSSDKIETVDVLKDSNAVKVYGKKAIYGAVVIKTKANTKLLRIKEILDKYNVPQTDKKLRICINKTVISQPELILIEASEILEVEITTDKNWINPEDANSTERFINIKTPMREKNSL